ncbi:hypothetical protein KM043_013473 [Ampulex compressa]|nr:hypothetical protein KM043_013473 [Ampulex compressa]
MAFRRVRLAPRRCHGWFLRQACALPCNAASGLSAGRRTRHERGIIPVRARHVATPNAEASSSHPDHETVGCRLRDAVILVLLLVVHRHQRTDWRSCCGTLGLSSGIRLLGEGGQGSVEINGRRNRWCCASSRSGTSNRYRCYDARFSRVYLVPPPRGKSVVSFWSAYSMYFELPRSRIDVRELRVVVVLG